MKRIWYLILIIGLVIVTACSDTNDSTDSKGDTEELLNLEVDFEVPETAEVGETIEVKATVTYGDELVTDADEVNFEYWTGDNKDASKTIDATNNGDGTYTAEITLEEEAVYSIYAHTTARGLHTMPLKEITVGDAVAEHNDEHDHEHADGFHLHFMEPEDVKAGEETELMVHLQLDNEALENAEVTYEIWADNDSENRSWVDVNEQQPGEYVANHTFEEPGTYHIQIHVENDDDLHEHEEFEIEVTE